MKRIFSEEEKNRLFKYVDDTQQFWLFDFFGDINLGNVRIEKYADDIDRYHRDLIDKNNMSKSKIQGLYSQVENTDVAYGNIIDGYKDDLNNYRSAVLSLRSLLHCYSSSGAEQTPILYSNGNFVELAESVGANMRKEVENRIYTEEGTYNWDAIHDILEQDECYITSIEYTVLAELLLDINDDEDLTKFFQCFAGKIITRSYFSQSTLNYGNISVKYETQNVTHDVLSYNVWPVDTNKLLKFQTILSAVITEKELVNEQINAIPDDIFAEKYGNVSKKSVLGDNIKSRNDILMKYFLIGEYANMVTQYGGEITGDIRENYPVIKINADENGDCTLTICVDEAYMLGCGVGGGVLYSTKEADRIRGLPQTGRLSWQYYHLNQHSIGITYPSNEGIEKDVFKNAEIYFLNTYANYSIDDVINAVASSELDSLASGLLDMVKEGVKCAPVIGWIVGAIDIGKGALEDISTNQQVKADISDTEEAFLLANYCDRMQLIGSVVSDGGSKQRVVFNPSQDTYKAIDVINEYLNDPNTKDSITDYGFKAGYKITIEDVYDSREQIMKIIEAMDKAGWEGFLQ